MNHNLRRLPRVAWQLIRRFDLDARLRMMGFVRRAWTEGPAERSVLTALVVFTLALTVSALPGMTSLAPALHTGVSIGLFALAWSVALATASQATSPLVLVVAAPWLVFYQGLMAGPWMGTPVALVPTAWLAWVVFERLRSSASPARGLAVWPVAAAGLAYVAAGASGLRRLLGWESIDARLLLWSVLALAGVIAMSRSRRQRPGFAYVFWGSLFSVGVTGAASLTRDAPGTVDALHLVFADAAAIVVLFWMWTAGRAAAEGAKGLEWAVRHVSRLLPPRLIVPGVPLVIVAVLAFGYVTAAPTNDSVERAMALARVWAGIAALALMGWWTLTRRVSAGRAILVLAWWLIAWTVFGGVVAGLHAVIDAYESRIPAAGIGLALVTVGLFLELGGLARKWVEASGERVRGSLAMMALSVSCAIALSTVPGNEWETTRSLMVLVGMLHFGLPLALYETWGKRLGGPSLGVTLRILIVAVGYTAGIAVLAIDPQQWLPLFAALPLLICLLVWLTWRRPTLPMAAGMLAGVLFTSGLIAAWMHPNPPTIPFVPAVALPRGVLLDKPLVSALHLRVLLAAWGAGGLAGWIVFRRRRAHSRA